MHNIPLKSPKFKRLILRHVNNNNNDQKLLKSAPKKQPKTRRYPSLRQKQCPQRIPQIPHALIASHERKHGKNVISAERLTAGRAGTLIP